MGFRSGLQAGHGKTLIPLSEKRKLLFYFCDIVHFPSKFIFLADVIVPLDIDKLDGPSTAIVPHSA